MKQMSKELSNVLLVVLCDYVLGAMEYLLLEQSTHIALSNGTISVGLQNYYDGNVTFENTSILLVDASTNQTVAKQEFLQYQSIVKFECFHFKNAGKYWFKMASKSQQHGETIPLSVKWPIFHFDLRRTSDGLGSSIQFKLFTSEYLCPINRTLIRLDIIWTSSFYDLEKLILNDTVGLRTSKELPLLRSQWVNYDCNLIGQEVYVTVLLRSVETNSVIASEGPINLMHRFGYKLVVEEVEKCDSSVVASVIPPPCTSPGGHIAVFKDLELPEHRTIKLHENILSPEDNLTEFNCTLFDEGTNKYCFEFSLSHRVDSTSRAKECVLIQRNAGSWGLWQAWSPCSVSCGDGSRERFRECPASYPLKQRCVGMPQEISSCSLEECPTTQSVPLTLSYPEDGQRAKNNLVTVTGISVCLSIIFATILITLWRKLCRSQKCGTSLHCDPTHLPSSRKNSDEENICQEREQVESFSEGETQGPPSGDPNVPFRRSFHFVQEGGGDSTNESFQSSAQKIIPPIFSYRLAQQQLKEMKKKGLTETTKVYHVSQNPLTDTVLSTSVGSGKQEGAAANTFRIKSPFLEQQPGYPKLSRDKSCSRVDFSLPQAVPSLSPSQSLTRRGQSRYPDNVGEPLERCYARNPQFRRTASFHETKKAKPFRKRSMSTLTPCQMPLYHSRARTWNHVPEEQLWPKSKNAYWNSEELELNYNPSSTVVSMTCGVYNPPKWEAPGKKLDAGIRQQAAQTLCVDRAEQRRNRKGQFLNHMTAWRNEANVKALRDSPQKRDPLSPTQYRKSKCQSFPSDPQCHFYDNTSFGMAHLEQQMKDLPGYFGSNEGEISSLSIDNLVL